MGRYVPAVKMHVKHIDQYILYFLVMYLKVYMFVSDRLRETHPLELTRLARMELLEGSGLDVSPICVYRGGGRGA